MPKAWHLIVWICSLMPAAGGVSFAKANDGGALPFVLITLVSILIGLAWAWLLEISRISVAAHAIPPSGSTPEWYGPALYVAAILWMGAAWVFGLWFSAAVLRVIQ